MAAKRGFLRQIGTVHTWARPCGLALTVLVVLAWVVDAVFADPPRPLLQALVLLWAAALALWWLAAAVRVARRRGDEEGRVTTGAILLILLGVSFVLRWVGVQFELVDHFHNDEGIFRRIGEEMNAGAMFPEEFHYPHLLYYVTGVALWLKDLFTPAWDAFARILFGAAEGMASTKLLLRLINASLGALTTIPVFWAAHRIAGAFAATVAGTLMAFSSVYNDVAHLYISDVPSGFFAALTLLFVARLLDGENLRDYLLAGVCSGLAAASKYPAGVVAVAIVAMWIYWRWRQRNLRWGLLWSGIASLGTFLAAMPALFVHSGSAFAGEGADITFGLRQYGGRGWIGVRVPSNFGYYFDLCVENFGWVAVILGVAGILVLARRERRRLMAMLPFALVFLWLMTSMGMVVKRNLQPVLPMLAVILGVGISAWLGFALRRAPGRRALVATVLAVGCVVVPAARIAAWDFSRTRPGTRQLSRAWINENVARGAGLLKEAYTPSLNPRHYAYRQTRYAGKYTVADLVEWNHDFLFLAANAHLRFLRPENLTQDHHRAYAEHYEEMFELELVQEFRPGPLRAGPALFIYRVDPDEIGHLDRRRFTLDEVSFYSDPKLKPREPGLSVRFTRRGQYVLFKEYMAPGRYVITVNPDGPAFDGALNLATRDNRQLGDQQAAPSAIYELDRPDRYFFYVFASAGELTGLDVSPVAPPPVGGVE